MKNCDEMVNSLLMRREQFLKRQKKKRNIMLGAVLSAFLVCAVLLGVGVGKNSGFGVTSSDNNETFHQKEAVTSYTQSASVPPNMLIDVIGLVKVDGVNYVQCSTTDKIYTPDVCLGNASDFEGTYKTYFRDSTYKLYTVKEDSDILLVKLENGDFLVLAREED